jgi:hypothetical protein
MHQVQINSGELSPSDLRHMVLSQSQLVALTEQVERARICKTNRDKPFCETFFSQVKNFIT